MSLLCVYLACCAQPVIMMASNCVRDGTGQKSFPEVEESLVVNQSLMLGLSRRCERGEESAVRSADLQPSDET
jgi:hypothetical protein